MSACRFDTAGYSCTERPSSPYVTWTTCLPFGGRRRCRCVPSSQPESEHPFACPVAGSELPILRCLQRQPVEVAADIRRERFGGGDVARFIHRNTDVDPDGAANRPA